MGFLRESEETARRHIATLQASAEAADAAVKATRAQIEEARSGLIRSKADREKAKATAEASRVTVEMVREAYKSNATSKYQLTEAERQADAATAADTAFKRSSDTPDGKPVMTGTMLPARWPVMWPMR